MSDRSTRKRRNNLFVKFVRNMALRALVQADTAKRLADKTSVKQLYRLEQITYVHKT